MAHYDGSSGSIIKPVRSPYGSPAVRWFQESTCITSNIIRMGDPVTFDTVVTTALRIVKAPSTQGAVGNLLQNITPQLVGIALADSTSDGSTLGQQDSSLGYVGDQKKIPVALADGLTEFSIQISSVGANPLPARSSMVGVTYPMEINRTYNRWFLSSTNLSTAADLSIVVTDVPVGVVNDTGATVYFKFLSTMVNRAIRVGGPFT